jgi:hypothetical protein
MSPSSYDYDKVKQILRYSYWRSVYQPLIGQLKMTPAELWDCKQDATGKFKGT